MSSNAKLTFCSGVGTVTGANFLLETPEGKQILIDCGMVQGEKIASDENRQPFPYEPSSIDALIITHAHLDHVGRIPKLVREGFTGPIYSTPETRSLAELVLNDAIGILGMEADREGLEPLYGIEDVSKVFPLWKTVPYHQSSEIISGIDIHLKDAGHILGSAMIEVTIKATGKKVLFTGDLGNSPAPLLRDTESAGNADYVVIESVYGDRNHESKQERDDKFEQIIKDTIAKQGTLIIPTFAIDRTQVLLYELNNLVEQKKIPSIPVFVDSPMATNATQIYAASTTLFNDAVKAQIARGDNVLSFPHLQFTVSRGQSGAITDTNGPKIILAGSGMSMGGRVVSHEQYYLPDPKSTLLLVGYQTTGSLGRRLADGDRVVYMNGQEVHVKAKVETLFGFSAHKDSDHLMEFMHSATGKIKKVFVVMGELKSALHLAQRINDEIETQAIVPERNKPYELV